LRKLENKSRDHLSLF